MTRTPAEVISRLLQNLTLASITGKTSPTNWRITVGSMPDGDGDDYNLAVYDTTPVTDGRMQRTGETVLHYGIQVKSQSIDYTKGYRKLNDVKAALDSVKNTEVAFPGSERFALRAFTLTSGIVPLGRGEKGRRDSFTLNGILTLHQTAT